MSKRLIKAEKKLAMEQYEKEQSDLWEQTKDKRILSFLMMLTQDVEVERFEVWENAIYIHRKPSEILQGDLLERQERISTEKQFEFEQDIGCYNSYNASLQKERERIGQEALAKQNALAKLTVQERKLLGLS